MTERVPAAGDPLEGDTEGYFGRDATLRRRRAVVPAVAIGRPVWHERRHLSELERLVTEMVAAVE